MKRALAILILLLTLIPFTLAQSLATVKGTDILVEDFQSRLTFEYGLTSFLYVQRYTGLQEQALQYGVTMDFVLENDAQMHAWQVELADPALVGQRTLDDMSKEILMRQYIAETGLELTNEAVELARAQVFGLNLLTATTDMIVAYEQRSAEITGQMAAYGVTSEALDAFYERYALRQMVTSLVVSNEFIHADVSHILVATEEEALALLEELTNGADFAELARTRSIDTGSGSRGGALGVQPIHIYVPEFAEAARSAEIGTVAGPVASQFGFHLLMVHSRELREVSAELLPRFQADEFNRWLEQTVSAANLDLPTDLSAFIPEGLTAPELPSPEAEVTPEATSES